MTLFKWYFVLKVYFRHFQAPFLCWFTIRWKQSILRNWFAMQGPVAIILISWNVIFIWETVYWTRAIQRTFQEITIIATGPCIANQLRSMDCFHLIVNQHKKGAWKWISWNVIFIWETVYWTRAIQRFALFDLLKSLYSDTKILSKYIRSLQVDHCLQIRGISPKMMRTKLYRWSL
jgi:hypothetical protein